MTSKTKSDFVSFMETTFSESSGRVGSQLERGDVVEGIVVQISGDSVFVDVGIRTEGRIAREEFENEQGQFSVSVGDRIEATVVDGRAAGGPLLSVRLMGNEIDKNALQIAMENSVPVEGKVVSVVKGGLEIDLGGTKAFCPASHIDIGYSDQIEQFVGHNHLFKILEIRDGGRSVIVSRRAVLEQERSEKALHLLEQLSVGDSVEGVVRSIQKYGAFVDIGGVEGLVHISELVHGRVERVEDVVGIGEKVNVQILEIEEGKKGPKLRLSMKALQDKSQDETEEISPDQVLTGTVSRFAPFGLFVETQSGEGLVPVQEIDLPPGSDHRRAFSRGQEIQVVLLSREPSSGKLRFSMRGVSAVNERRNFEQYRTEKSLSPESKSAGSGLGSLGDLLVGKKLPLPAAPAVPKISQKRTQVDSPKVSTRKDPLQRPDTPSKPPSTPKSKKKPSSVVIRRRPKE